MDSQTPTTFALSDFQGNNNLLPTFSKLTADEQGFVSSAELVLVMTIAVLEMAVGDVTLPCLQSQTFRRRPL